MVNLYNAILTLYPNAIPLVDFVLTDSSITFWNSALGTQPTTDQLEAVTQDQVDASQLASTLAQVPALMTEVTALNSAIKLGDIYNAQQVNALVQWINATVVPALNLTSYTIPTDITSVDPSPCTVQDGLTQSANVLTTKPGWLTITP